jgi:CBS domain-containing protein
MPDRFIIAEHMEKLTPISDKLSVSQALEELKRSTGLFAVVDEANRPQALLRDEYLALLPEGEDVPLASILDRLPPLITVEAEVESLNANELRMFGRLLFEIKSPGLVVLRADKPVGTISRGDIAHAIPVKAITNVTSRTRFGANASPIQFTQYCNFVCQQCQSRRRPRECDTAPICPRDPDHGEMNAT